ncbi:MAG: Rrf2 family transcriptional regulator [Planctomycetota bacterium]
MKLSAKTEYACLAMLQLAADHDTGRPAPLKSLSAKQSIPEGFLVQILQDLRRAGLVVSTRGASGGYRLARAPEEVSLAEVVTATEGSVVPAEGSACSSPLAVALHSVCEDLRHAQRRRLESLSLAGLLERSTVSNEPMWYI